jgi:hypothetical protein
MKHSNTNQRTIGALLIIGSIAVLIPYTILTIIFNYPDILRLDAANILIKFHEGGSKLIWTWFTFAVAGIPLLPAYILLGKELENKSSLTKIATSIGVLSLIVQMIGLLRWTFVVPILADLYTNAQDDNIRSATIVAFKTIHQFGGVLLGEFLGQLFTIAWTILISIIFIKEKLMPKAINILGITSSLIYLMAQAELFKTVIPSIVVWDLAGFLGSTLWLVWMIFVGIKLLSKRQVLN